MNKLNGDKILLAIILLTGASLRFYNFSSMQLMNDELSALVRTNFSSLKLLIAGGVCIDGHPPLVQVFLFYWIKIAGNTEIALRFPFIIAGIFSIYLVFKIGSHWFNSTVGLIAASFISTLQYTIFYSQIARPYSSGLFFSLLMVWCWTNIFFNNSHKKIGWYCGYVLSSIFCAYNHHFSLLFAFIVGGTGLFFLNKTNAKFYLLSGFLIVLFYLPNLPIFFAQLKMGGIGGWLAVPTPVFFINYLKYIFHFSLLIYILVLVLIVLSLFFKSKTENTDRIDNKFNFRLNSRTNKFRIISFFWFLLPILIGYFYSVYINPVVQYSMLIFSFPFFLFIIFSFFKELSILFKAIIVFFVIGLNTYTLIAERLHYKIFYTQPYEQFVKDTFAIIDSVRQESNISIYTDSPPKFLNYYFDKENRKFRYFYFDKNNLAVDIPNFIKLLNGLHSNYFIINGFNLDYVALVKEKYPYLVKRNSGFTYDFYCFSKIKPPIIANENILFSIENNFETPTPGWNIDTNKIITNIYDIAENSGAKKYLLVDSLTEYAATYETNLTDIINTKYIDITASVRIKNLNNLKNLQLVLSLESNGKHMFWRSSEVAEYNPKNGTEFTARLNINLRDQNFDYSEPINLKIYLWNKDKANFEITNFKIEIAKSNPIIYGLYEKIEHEQSD